MKLISQKKLYKRQSKKQDSKQQKLKQLYTLLAFNTQISGLFIIPLNPKV